MENNNRKWNTPYDLREYNSLQNYQHFDRLHKFFFDKKIEWEKKQEEAWKHNNERPRQEIVKVSSENRKKLMQLKLDKNFKSIDEVVTYLFNCRDLLQEMIKDDKNWR